MQYWFRRRRGPRAATIVVAALALLGGLGVAAVVMAETGGKRSPAAARGAPTLSQSAGLAASGEARPRQLPPPSAAALARRRESNAIAAVLRYTPFIASGTPRHRVVALTFDDGPSPYTPAIVRALVRLHVPATFFVVGQQLAYFSAGLREELAHGFEIGDHTQNHAWLVRLGTAGQYAQLRQAAQGAMRVGARFPLLFRPPYGAYDRRTLAVLRRLRMLMVLWTIDPGDWRRPGVRAIVSNVLSHARPGAIVIMHDGGGDRSQTLAALPAIIRGLRRRGYELVSVPQLIALDPPPRRQRLPPLGGA